MVLFLLFFNFRWLTVYFPRIVAPFSDWFATEPNKYWQTSYYLTRFEILHILRFVHSKCAYIVHMFDIIVAYNSNHNVTSNKKREKKNGNDKMCFVCSLYFDCYFYLFSLFALSYYLSWKNIGFRQHSLTFVNICFYIWFHFWI